MNIRKTYCFMAMLLVAVLDLKAQSVAWSVMPAYEEIKPYSAKLYLCQLQGKWGLMDVEGHMTLPAQYDFVMLRNEGWGIFGIVEEGQNKLAGFIRPDGSQVLLDGDYYVVKADRYSGSPTGFYLDFSEDKFCVADASGKKGFVDKSGQVVVKCQFDAVRPFQEGVAAVAKDKVCFYIYEGYDRSPKDNILYVDWNDGIITLATSFENGEAIVGYGGKCRVINRYGNVVRNLSLKELNGIVEAKVETGGEGMEAEEASSFSELEVFAENGRYGFRSSEKTVLLPAFESASSIDHNQASIVSYKGRFGILKVVDGSVEASLSSGGAAVSEIRMDQRGKPGKLQYAATLPPAYVGRVSLWVDRGNGTLEDVSMDAISEGNRLTYDFYPEVGRKENEVTLGCRLLYEDMEVYAASNTLPVKRPIRLRLSEPSVETELADIKTEIQQVSAVIYNDSGSDVTVTATLSVHCSANEAASHTSRITIRARSSQTVSVPVKVKTDEQASAVIRLSSGEQKSSTVSLRIY